MVRGIEDGLSYQLIDDLHFISFETVRSHMRNVYCKLQMNPRTSCWPTPCSASVARAACRPRECPLAPQKNYMFI